MPLTPTDVANKQFKIVFRGYSLDEVDGFLDEVESELTRLMRDNNDLRNSGDGNRLVPAFTAAAPVQDAPAEAPAETPAETPAAETAAADAPQHAQAEPAAPEPVASVSRDEPAVEADASAGDPELQRVAASGDGGRAALRMLQMAQQTAEQAIAEARAEAAAILEPARGEADATLAAARTEAEQLLSGARERTAAVDADIAQKVAHAMGDLEVQRAVLERNIEQLREFEREYRRRLTSYLEGQLQELGSTGTAQELEAPQAVDLPSDGDVVAPADDTAVGDGSTPAQETPRTQGWS